MTHSIESGARAPIDGESGDGKLTQPLVDIGVVFVVSVLVYTLEGWLDAAGWVAVAADARGASAVVAGAIAALFVVRMRGGSFADLGFRRPERWSMVPLQVLAILIVFVALQLLVPAFLSLFFELPPADWSRYDAVAGNLGAALTMALILPFTASIPEEIIYRGFLIGRLTGMLEHHRHGPAIAVLLHAVIFGSIHFTWGIGGMVMTFIMGLVWGTAYLLVKRNLWVVIMAHTGGHLLMVTQLYYA